MCHQDPGQPAQQPWEVAGSRQLRETSGFSRWALVFGDQELLLRLLIREVGPARPSRATGAGPGRGGRARASGRDKWPSEGPWGALPLDGGLEEEVVGNGRRR